MNRADIKAAGLNNRLLAKLTGRTESQVSRWLNEHEDTPEYVDTIVFAWMHMTNTERQQLLARRTKGVPAMTTTASVYPYSDFGVPDPMQPAISEEYDIFGDTPDAWADVEAKAEEIAAGGTKCCIKWQRPSDGQIAYWGPQGACFEPHWYGR